MARVPLRNLPGFDAAVAEVVQRCAPGAFKGLCKRAGAWIPPESINTVTPVLLYNLCVGMDRNGGAIDRETKVAEERQERSNVVPLVRSRTMADIDAQMRAKNEATTGAPWLPAWGLDGLNDRGEPRYPWHGQTERLGYEPTAAEIRAGLFGMGEGTP